MKHFLFFVQIFFVLIFLALSRNLNQFETISGETQKAESTNNFNGNFLGYAPPITQLDVVAENGMIETLNQNTSLLNSLQENPCLLREEPTMKLCESLSCDLCMASDKCGITLKLKFIL